MKLKPELRAQVDDNGRLVLPPEVRSRYGLRPGAQVYVDERPDRLGLRRAVNHLSKVYIEPTNRCNLECRTCLRNVWDEPLGQMNSETFLRIVEGLKVFSPPPSVFFGGFGEPLAHPNIVEMIAQTKTLGARVELITNGTLLTQEMSRELIAAGIDMLWISLDGATPESYADVRLGATLPEVLANLRGFSDARGRSYYYFFPEPSTMPQIGIVFVAMKRNVTDLPSIIRMGNRLGATHFLVTNVLPYSADMCKEVLYSRALNDFVYLPSSYRMELPKMDIDRDTSEPIFWTMRSGHTMSFAGANLAEASDRCPFIEKGAVAIRWDGEVSPCLPLLHDHRTFLNGYERSLRRYAVGTVAGQELYDLWNLPEYLSLRERVQKFDFSPCTFCAGCDFVEKNEEDCFGNIFPTCGGCLWAQGVIQCP